MGAWNQVGDLHSSLLGRLAVVNIWLVLFNLIPAFPMDGGRVLRAILAFRMNYLEATEIAVKAGRWIAVVIGGVGLVLNPFLTVIAVFIYVTAGQELKAAEARGRTGAWGYEFEPAVFEPTEIFQPPMSDHEFRRARDRISPVLDEWGRVIGWVRKEQSNSYEPVRTFRW